MAHFRRIDSAGPLLVAQSAIEPVSAGSWVVTSAPISVPTTADDALRSPAPTEFRVTGYSKSCSFGGRSNWRSIDLLLSRTFSPLVFSLYVVRTFQATKTATAMTIPTTSITRPYSHPVSNARSSRVP
jgi:hypothetical protein